MRIALFDYPCRDATGSLHIIPPDSTRTEMFCGSCPFYNGARLTGCLFLPSWSDDTRLPRGRTAAQRAWYARKSAEMRRELKTPTGEPLSDTCWNCKNIRRLDTLFVCGKEEHPRPYSAAAMQQHRACKLFFWRTEMEILPFATKAENTAIAVPLSI